MLEMLETVAEAAPPRHISFERDVVAQLDALYSLALHLTRREQDAEDLVQDTVARAFSRRHQFQPGTNLRAWLYTIERSLFVSAYRRERRAPLIRSLDEEEAAEHALYDGRGTRSSPSAEQELLHWWVSEEIVAALQALPEHYRVAVLLSDVAGLSYAEMAQTMDVAPGTVMSRLHRGRAGLRQALRGPDGDPDAPVFLSVDAVEPLMAAA